jgi:UDP-N-acetylmuramoyl-tripeptide--D-alanyl-D-alanine ligase
LAATGRHHLTAALASVAIGREVGMSSQKIAEGLRMFVAADGRCRMRQFGPCTIIDDTYNANPRSMRAACDVLRDWPGTGKRMLVAGDMLELAERADDCHRAMGQTVARNRIDRLLVIGQNAAQAIAGAIDNGMETHHLAQCGDIESLLAVLDCWLEHGDVVLVKGSRAMRMERVIEWISNRYEETSQGNEARVLLRACA